MGIPWVLVGRRIVLLEILLPQYWFGEKCCLKNARQPWFMIGAPVFRVLLRVIVSSAVYSVHLRYAIQHFVRYRSSPQGAEHLDFKKKGQIRHPLHLTSDTQTYHERTNVQK